MSSHRRPVTPMADIFREGIELSGLPLATQGTSE